MSAAMTVSASAAISGVTVVNTSYTQTQEAFKIWDFSLSASQTNYALSDAAITIAKIKSIFMLFDTAVTLKTNSTGSPQETLTFAANVPLIWDASSPLAIGTIFAGNITAMYLTNSTAATAVKIYMVIDN